MNELRKRKTPREKIDALSSLVFVVDQDLWVQEYKATASVFLMAEGVTVLKRRVCEIMHCIHSGKVEEGCGISPLCADCVIGNSVTEAFQESRVVCRRARIELLRGAKKIAMHAQITASPVSFQNWPLVLLVIDDMKEG